MAKKKVKGSNLPVPQSDTEAASALARIGVLARDIARIECTCNDAVSKLTEDAGVKAAPLREREELLIEGLKTYCEANRDRLTEGGRSKTIVFATGAISWRTRPASVKLRDKVEVIVERIKALKLIAFLRTKEEINKEAMLADQETAKSVTGVSIASDGEDFFVEPLEVNIAEDVS